MQISAALKTFCAMVGVAADGLLLMQSRADLSKHSLPAAQTVPDRTCRGADCDSSGNNVKGIPFAAVDALAFPRASTGSTSMSSLSGPKLPKGRQIAIVLRGESFRYEYNDADGKGHRKSCAEEAVDVQMACTHSLIENIIDPLEQRDNVVHVFVATNQPLAARYAALDRQSSNSTLESTCKLDRLLFEAFANNSNREVTGRSLVTNGQADSMLKVVDAFEDQYGGSAESVMDRFLYVLIARYDLYWHKPIYEWSVDWGNINVLSRCEMMYNDRKGGVDCVHDTFWMMPGILFPSFTASIEHDLCYNPARDPDGHGHACQPVMKDELAKRGYKDAFGWVEPGRRMVRGEPSDYADLSFGTP